MERRQLWATAGIVGFIAGMTALAMMIPGPAKPNPRFPGPSLTSTTNQPVIEQTTEAPGPAEVYYANCFEARDAGAAPIRRGQPGYRGALDRDGDGVACDK